MKFLVTYGSKMGGTHDIADVVAAGLAEHGIDAVVEAPEDVDSLERYDAVVVGGALYMRRWHRAVSRFVRRHHRELANLPVWFFSSGPLDDSATETDIAPVRQVRKLMDRVGARGHLTVGGRLSEDAEGFLASRLAKESAGDWRDMDQVRTWTESIAARLGAAENGG